MYGNRNKTTPVLLTCDISGPFRSATIQMCVSNKHKV